MRELETIQKEEKQLYLKEEVLTNEIKQVNHIREIYDEYLYEARQFFGDVCYQFNKNEQGNVYKSVFEEFTYKSRQMKDNLEACEADLRCQKKKISNQLEDIAHEKRKVSLEEVPNEY